MCSIVLRLRDYVANVELNPATRRSLQTSDHPDQRDWAGHNLPLILFYLVPPKLPKSELQSLKEDGVIVGSYHEKPIRDLKILPRHISVNVEPWRIAAWRLLDPRVTYQDILDRMTEDEVYQRPTKNALQQSVYRNVRKLLHSFVGQSVRGDPQRVDVEAIEDLTSLNVERNTVLSEPCIEFDPQRLVKLGLFQDDSGWKAELVNVTKDNVQAATVPMHYFRTGHDIDGPFLMSQRMNEAFTLLLQLQYEAAKQGLEHWTRLEKKYFPDSWHDRIKHTVMKQKKEEKDNTAGMIAFTQSEESDVDDVVMGGLTYANGSALARQFEDAADPGDIALPAIVPSDLSTSHARNLQAGFTAHSSSPQSTHYGAFGQLIYGDITNNATFYSDPSYSSFTNHGLTSDWTVPYSEDSNISTSFTDTPPADSFFGTPHAPGPSQVFPSDGNPDHGNSYVFSGIGTWTPADSHHMSGDHGMIFNEGAELDTYQQLFDREPWLHRAIDQ